MAKVLKLPNYQRHVPARRVRARSGRRPGRQKGMNGLEAAWSFRLEEMRRTGGENPVVGWWFHALKLRIGEDCFYETDFLVQLADGTLELHEVKGGHIEDDAVVKLRSVVDQYPFRVLLVRRRPKAEGGGWRVTEF